jgi:hypothetical protein
LVLTGDEAAICEAVGVRAFVHARSAAARGELAEAKWDRPAGRGYAVVRGATTGFVTASVLFGADGALKSIDGVCTCELAPGCDHPIALVLVSHAAAVPKRRSAPSWESALAAIVGADADASEGSGSADLALQFEVEDGETRSLRRIGLRPVIPGKRGWVRTGISWGSLDYGYHPGSARAEHHVELLLELLSLADSADRDPYSYYGAGQRVIYLDEFRSRRVWDVLLEAQEVGLPFVQSGRNAASVAVAAEPVRFSVRADRAGADLRLHPVLMAGTDVIDSARSTMLGQPAHGVAWWGTVGQEVSKGPGTLRLAPMARPVSAEAMRALAAPAIVVPVADESRFLRQYYPGLVRQADVVSLDESAPLPVIGPAELTLTAQRLPGHRMSLTWEWVSVFGTESHREPLRGGVGEQDGRARTVRQATDLVAAPEYGLTEPFPGGRRLLSHAVVAGDVMLRLLRDVFPRLVETDGIDVVIQLDNAPEYVEEPAAPVVSFAGAARDASAGQPDWFDLSVQVAVGGEEVGFDELFVALAAEQEFMILPSGRYFTLDRAEFRQLRDLIAEARELEDAPAGVLRIGRFQAGLWQELAELGEVTGQAAAWQEAVRALSAAGVGAGDALPTGLAATLRPYQQDGFRWLAALYRHTAGIPTDQEPPIAR